MRLTRLTQLLSIICRALPEGMIFTILPHDLSMGFAFKLHGETLIHSQVVHVSYDEIRYNADTNLDYIRNKCERAMNQVVESAGNEIPL